jgi:hypothetical protein
MQPNNHIIAADDALRTLISVHLQRYPSMELTDIYRLLHQGAFGVGHPIANRKAAREWLEHESRLGPPGGPDPLIESVHPQGSVVRFHVRGFLARGGRLPALLDAYVRSAESYVGDPALMAHWWGQFEAMLTLGQPLAGRFDLRVAQLLRKANEPGHWPMMHHSPTFIQRYQPVYRILTVDAAAALCTEHGFAFSVL